MTNQMKKHKGGFDMLNRIPSNIMKEIESKKRWIEKVSGDDAEYLIISKKMFKALNSQQEELYGKPVKLLKVMGLKVFVDDDLWNGEMRIF